MRTFIENYLHFMKNCIRPHYEKLKPLKSGFMENSNFENNRDPCPMGNHHAFGRAPASAPASRPRACGAKRRHQATRHQTHPLQWLEGSGGWRQCCLQKQQVPTQTCSARDISITPGPRLVVNKSTKKTESWQNSSQTPSLLLMKRTK